MHLGIRTVIKRKYIIKKTHIVYFRRTKKLFNFQFMILFVIEILLFRFRDKNFFICFLERTDEVSLKLFKTLVGSSQDRNYNQQFI